MTASDQPRVPAPVLAAISAGGVLGALARHGLGVAWPHAPGAFPWATLGVNASGCLLIGVLMVIVTRVVTDRPLLRPFLGTGVLGGYTTFSTYATDIHQLSGAGHPLHALAYLALTVVSALAAVAAGYGVASLVVGDRVR